MWSGRSKYVGGVGHAVVVNRQAVHVSGGHDYLLVWVGDSQVSGEVLPRHPEAGALVQLEGEAALPDAVASLILGVRFLFIGVFPPTITRGFLFLPSR